MSANDERLLGRGIYDAAEVARLVRRPADDVVRWAVPAGDRDALLFPRERRLLSFYDLVTAVVVSEFRRRGVPLTKIRDARRHLAREFAVDWPFAHAVGLEALASVGSDVYLLGGSGWEDASRGGQTALQQVVGPLLHRLEFDHERMATLWRPVDGVVVDPRVQAGAPCVEGTRIATQLVAELHEAGEAPEDIAHDYGLDLAAVRLALSYERDLVAAA